MLQGLGLGGAGAASGSGASGGRRLIVFVIGGVTRSEMRAVHELSKRSGREVLLGSTTVLKPAGFLSQLRSMGSAGQ
jgi:syntaxin-binding protein 1